jgi:hypothetical protein
MKRIHGAFPPIPHKARNGWGTESQYFHAGSITTDDAANFQFSSGSFFIHILVSDMDGGAASGLLPHSLFGTGPIFSTSFPPLAISPWLNQVFIHGFPFSIAD